MRLTLSDGTVREGQFGWEDVQSLPDGTVVQPSFYEEARYHAIGMVENLLLFVAFMYRQDSIRLISARKVTPRERRHYHEV